jgi:hypothetical protein
MLLLGPRFFSFYYWPQTSQQQNNKMPSRKDPRFQNPSREAKMPPDVTAGATITHRELKLTHLSSQKQPAISKQ